MFKLKNLKYNIYYKMRIYRVLTAIALAVIGITIFVISLLFKKKREQKIRENKEEERYIGKYEVKRQ